VRPTGEVDVVGTGGSNNELVYYWATPGSVFHSFGLTALGN